jgi:hypothetical protein
MAYAILAWVSPIFARSPRAITVLNPCPDGDNTTLTAFREIVRALQCFYGLTSFNFKDVDEFLWIVGDTLVKHA